MPVFRSVGIWTDSHTDSRTMYVWLGIALVYFIGLEAREKVTRTRQKQESDVSDDDILDVLSDLISASEETRRGRLVEDSEENIRESADQTILFNRFIKCDVVGYEFRKGEECKEVFEIECAPANVTKTRTELVEKCKTTIDQKCGMRITEVPQPHCRQRIKNKYEHFKALMEGLKKNYESLVSCYVLLMMVFNFDLDILKG